MVWCPLTVPYTGSLKILHPLQVQELTQSQPLTENLLWLPLPLIQDTATSPFSEPLCYTYTSQGKEKYSRPLG